MKSRVIISVLLATFAQGAFGRRQDQNPQGFQSRIRTDYSILQELYKTGVLAYWKTINTLYTDVEKVFYKNSQDQQRSDCSNNTIIDSGKAQVAAAISMAIDVSLVAALAVIPGSVSAIDAARTVGHGQAEQLADTFYGAMLATCEGNTSATRLKLDGMKNLSLAGVAAYEENLFAPILSDESIGEKAKATALIVQDKAISQLVIAVQTTFDAFEVLKNAASYKTETEMRTAASKIRIFGKEVFQRLKTEHGIRLAFLESILLANSIIEAAGSVDYEKISAHSNVLEISIAQIETYLSAIKGGKKNGNGFDSCKV